MTTAIQIALCVLGVNLLSCLVYGWDKLMARSRKRRVPEATLLALGALGGSVGAMLGMVLFRHKTDARAHPAFVWGVPLMFLAQLGAAAYLIQRAL